MLKVDPNTANLATLQNFDVAEKKGCLTQNQQPKFIKFDSFQTKYIFGSDQC